MKGLKVIIAVSTLVVSGCAMRLDAGQIAAPPKREVVAYDDYEARNKIRRENPLDASYVGVMTNFATALVAHTLAEQKGNMCVSPVSLYTALSLAAEGAGGETKDELLRVLGAADVGFSIAAQTRYLMRSLYFDNEIGALRMANSLWLAKGGAFKQAYLDTAAADYFASVWAVDFAESSTGGLMSAWIAEQTSDMLKPLIETDAATRLALVNTIYLKDQWVTQFNSKQTAPDTFLNANGTESIIPFMNHETLMGAYRKGSGFTAAPLALKNGGEMIFILPDDGITVDALLAEQAVVAEMLHTSWTDTGRVIFKIPKFAFDAAPDVLEAVQAMGVKHAFADADFGGISNEALFISSIQQETRIGIDEDGVEAAGYTMIMMAGSAMPEEQEPVEMTLDRPFLFAVVSDTGVPLFTGVVNQLTE